MDTPIPAGAFQPLSRSATIFHMVVAVVAFHLAYRVDILGGLIVAYLYALIMLSRVRSNRAAFYLGLGVGFATVAPTLDCFYRIFGAGAVALWMILAVWIGLFVLLARLARVHAGALGSVILIPFLWTGLEFFRSELYYLRFAWANVGYALANSKPLLLMPALGVFGVAFVATFLSLLVTMRPRPWARPRQWRVLGMGIALAVAITATYVMRDVGGAHSGAGTAAAHRVQVAGLQLEFGGGPDVVVRDLNRLIAAYPATELVVLNEAVFVGSVPDDVRAWCRTHGMYLVAGGKDILSEDAEGNQTYYNTAFVVDPAGEIVFKQAKSVPIQFFADGLPAPSQVLWNSPWGRIGILICYDLSYTKVTDRLVALGAEALIVPTMDEAHWGAYEHQLHGRIAPVRAAEYGIPIVRVASSGISQIIDRDGHVTASAPFSEEVEMLGGTIELAGPGQRPPDRWLARFAVGVTGGFVLWLLILAWRRRFGTPPEPLANPEPPAVSHTP